MEIKLQVDTRQVRKALAQLGSKAPTAMMRALNRTAATVRTHAVRGIASDLAIAQRRVRENITITRARPSALTAAVVARPGGKGVGVATSKSERVGRIPIFEFRARGPYPSRGKGRGVRYRLPSGKGSLPHAFIAIMASGHKGVFVRLPGTQMPSRPDVSREKIAEVFGPSIPRVFANRQILKALMTRGRTELSKNMDNQINFLLGRQGKRRG